MAWLHAQKDWPFLPASFEVGKSQRLSFDVLPDTGAAVNVFPGTVIRSQSRSSLGGLTARYTTVQVLSRERIPHIVELSAIGACRVRKWGQSESTQTLVFPVVLEVSGCLFSNISVIFLPPCSDEEVPHIVLGRPFLFENGGCCFDNTRKRIRRYRCFFSRFL